MELTSSQEKDEDDERSQKAADEDERIDMDNLGKINIEDTGSKLSDLVNVEEQLTAQDNQKENADEAEGTDAVIERESTTRSNFAVGSKKLKSQASIATQKSQNSKLQQKLNLKLIKANR